MMVESMTPRGLLGSRSQKLVFSDSEQEGLPRIPLALFRGSHSMWKVQEILWRCGVLSALLAYLLTAAEPATIADLAHAFAQPPDDTRIMMRWWWFGPKVSKPELERELRQMKAGGIGGFEVQPVYPLEAEGNDSY